MCSHKSKLYIDMISCTIVFCFQQSMFTVYILLEESHYSIRLFRERRAITSLNVTDPDSNRVLPTVSQFQFRHGGLAQLMLLRMPPVSWCECLQPGAGEPCFSECVFNAKGRRSTKVVNQTEKQQLRSSRRSWDKGSLSKDC